MNNVLREYNEIKEEVKNSVSSVEYTINKMVDIIRETYKKMV